MRQYRDLKPDTLLHQSIKNIVSVEESLKVIVDRLSIQ